MGHIGQVIQNKTRKLKQERKHCLAELRCNIVTMKGSRPKVLRLNLECSSEIQTPFFSAASSPVSEKAKLQGQRMRHSTPVSSPEEPSTSYTRTSGENSLSSSDIGTPTFLFCQQNPLYEKQGIWSRTSNHINDLDNPTAAPDSITERIIILSTTSEMFNSNDKRVFWIPQDHDIDKKRREIEAHGKGLRNAYSLTQAKFDNLGLRNEYLITEGLSHKQNFGEDLRFNSSIREAVSLGRTSSIPPPLCSICQQKSPTFGKPPRQFYYQELEEATDGFSDKNFLAEGGFGLVHRGVLRDGLVVAIKQLKFAGSQADADFCREVRVLSCAQHRNVVLLIGYCIEQNKRLLVYEYICNGSLDLHLHGKTVINLDWDLRLKIAIGAARGLRYLHEDCRVGCIIHRDMRPHNILLTHDFQPLVADFGLARLYSEWEFCDEERVVGTSGYLAPEYFNGAKFTEKVDIYAFGLVLLELITSQKTWDLQWHDGQQFSLENFFCHLLSRKNQLPHSHMAGYQLHNLPFELQAMGHAATQCLQKDPDLRPPMSKVLRLLEGRGTVLPLELDMNSTGSRSGRMNGLNASTSQSRSKHSRRLSH